MSDGPLLEVLAARMGCIYLSDLKYLHNWERLRLERILEKVPVEAVCRSEWNDALRYLAGVAPKVSAGEAKGKLLDFLLSQPRAPTMYELDQLCQGQNFNDRRENK